MTLRKCICGMFRSAGVACVSIVAVSMAQALPLFDFTGHSDGTLRGGTSSVNFAVLTPGDSLINTLSEAFRPAIGAPNLDPGQFTYLYQVTDRSGLIHDLGLQQTVTSTTIGSFDSGNFRLDFIDQGTVVNTAGLFQQGCSLSGPRCAGDGPGGDLDGVQDLGIAGRTVSNAERVTVSTSLTSLGQQGQLGWSFSSQNSQQGLTGGFTSPLFGYQSPSGPTVGNAVITVGDRFTPDVVFGIPVAASEPLSVLLFASGLMGLAAWGRMAGVKRLPPR